jgi:hypothetical protein
VARRINLEPEALAREPEKPEPAAAPNGGEALSDLTGVDALPILLVDDREENLRTLEAVLAPLSKLPLRAGRHCASCLNVTLP